MAVEAAGGAGGARRLFSALRASAAAQGRGRHVRCCGAMIVASCLPLLPRALPCPQVALTEALDQVNDMANKQITIHF